MNTNIDLIRRINKNIVRPDGTIDSFEKQLLYLSGGIFDVTQPLIVSPESSAISYFTGNIHKPITMRVSTAIKIREKHEIGYAFVSQCLDMLKESVMAFDSMTHDSSKVVLLNVCSLAGDPYIAIIRTDKLINMLEVNEITSVYDKREIERFLTRTFNSNKRFYKNKKTEQYIKSQQLQLPKEMIYALSDAYSKPIFTKSQVEADINAGLKVTSSPKPALTEQLNNAAVKAGKSRQAQPQPKSRPHKGKRSYKPTQYRKER